MTDVTCMPQAHGGDLLNVRLVTNPTQCRARGSGYSTPTKFSNRALKNEYLEKISRCGQFAVQETCHLGFLLNYPCLWSTRALMSFLNKGVASHFWFREKSVYRARRKSFAFGGALKQRDNRLDQDESGK